jgi:hypothetical protein
MRRLTRLCLLALLATGLMACQSEEQGVDPAALAADGPADVAVRIADNLKNNNLLAMVETALPPSDFASMREEYERERKEAPSDEERAEFAKTMTKLTEPDAETKLMAELEPALVKFETEMQAQMPMFLAMGRGFAQQWVMESKDLTDVQKQQTQALVDAAAKWLESVKFADRALARVAITKAVSTARSLELATLDDVQKLEFEQAMEKAGVVLGGAKSILAVYGLDVDKSLASVKSSVKSESADTAVVDVTYTLFDQPLSVETEMVKKDDRWYSKDTLKNIESQRAGASSDDMDDMDEDMDADESVEAPAAEAQSNGG